MLFSAMTVPNAPAMTMSTEANARTATVPVGQIFTLPSIVDSISVAVERASGTIVFQHYRMLGTPMTCRFTVVAEFETPTLTQTGWQTVSTSDMRHAQEIDIHIGL